MDHRLPQMGREIKSPDQWCFWLGIHSFINLIYSSKFPIIVINQRQHQFIFIPLSSIIMNQQTNSRRKSIGRSECAINPFDKVLLLLQNQPNNNEMVTFQTHSQKLDLNKAEENELFGKVEMFITLFLTDAFYRSEIVAHLTRYAALSVKMLGNGQKQKERQISFKKVNVGSKVCFEIVADRKQSPPQPIRNNNKKISILIMEEEYENSEGQFSNDDLATQLSVKTLRSIEIPPMDLSVDTIQLIFDSPSPFVITLSLCLFIRYCLKARQAVTLQSCSWVLSVSTIIAYKLYYDQEIEGLMDCFMGIMKINKKDLIDLERCYLQEIDYNTVIRNYDYQYVMSKLVAVKISA